MQIAIYVFKNLPNYLYIAPNKKANMKNLLLTLVAVLFCSITIAQTRVNTPIVSGSPTKVERYGNYVYLNDVSAVDGVNTTSNLVRIDASTGALDVSWQPQPNNYTIYDIAEANGKIIVAGDFTEISGQPRSHIAVYNGITGALEPIAPFAPYTVTALYVDGNDVYFAGHDTTSQFGSQESGTVVKKFDLNTGVVSNWIVDYAISYLHDIWSMTILDNYLYVGGDFTSVHVFGQTTQATAIPMGRLARYDKVTGQLDQSWVKHVTGGGYPEVYAVTAHNNKLYVGGDFDTIAGVARESFASFFQNGNMTSLNPVDYSQELRVIESDGNDLWLGGYFSYMFGWPRQHIAEVNVSVPFEEGVTCWVGAQGTIDRIYDIEVAGDTVYCVGLFYAGNSNGFSMYIGEGGLPLPTIQGPDTIMLGDPSSFTYTPNNGYTTWWTNSTRNNFTPAGATYSFTFNNSGWQTVSLYTFNNSCYGDTVTKDVYVMDPNVDSLASSVLSPYYGYFGNGTRLYLEYSMYTNQSGPFYMALELSDGTGDFTNATILARDTVNNPRTNETMYGVLCGLPSGNNYKARIICTNKTFQYTLLTNGLGWYIPGYNVFSVDGSPHDLNVSPTNQLICSGTQLTYEPSIPWYQEYSTWQWYKGGQLVGTGPSFTDPTPNSVDSVYLVSTRDGCVNVSIKELPIIASSLPTEIDIISVANGAMMCPGDVDTIKITDIRNPPAINGNGVSWCFGINSLCTNYSGNDIALIDDHAYQAQRGDSIWYRFRRFDGCVPFGTYSYSNIITNNFYPAIEPTISTAYTTVCSGASVDITSSTVNGTAQSTYQWYRIRNGFLASLSGQTGDTISLTAIQNGDEYYLQVTGSNNCPSDIDTSNHLVFTISNGSYYMLNDTGMICQGESYLGYTTTGVYTDTLTGTLCVDTILTLDLTVLDIATDTFDVDIYAGQTHEGYGTTGTYVDTFMAANSCDSIRTLNLTVTPLDTIWPGDANADGVVDNTDLLNIGIAYGSTGAARPSASLTWVGQACQPWADSFVGGLNYNHADCNGDGTVDATDSNAIIINYGLTHLKREIERSMVDPVLSLEPAHPYMLYGASSYIDIVLGESTLPAQDIYGLAFTVNYDPDYVNDTSLFADLGICWIGDLSFDMISLQKNVASGRLDLALVRTDQNNEDGYGSIGKIYFNTLDQSPTTDSTSTDITLSNIVAIDEQGNLLPLNTADAAVGLYNLPNSIEQNTLGSIVPTVYPNPANDKLTVYLDGAPIDAVQCYDVAGRMVLASDHDRSTQTTINTSELQSGMYLLRIRSGNYWYQVKIAVSK